jgi:hypothetical protein
MAPKPTRRDLLKTTATLAATSALAFDRATVAWARDADALRKRYRKSMPENPEESREWRSV